LFSQLIVRMKFFYCIFSLLLLVFSLGACKPKPLAKQEMLERVKEQATEMGTALVHKEYGKVVDFSYPELVKKAGGKNKMVEAMEKGIKTTEMAGTFVLGVTLGEPSDIIKEADEWQCTISQQTKVKTPDGNNVYDGVLIGISKDEGHHWTFLEVNDAEFFLMQANFPNLSSRLRLPGSAQEIFNDTVIVR